MRAKIAFRFYMAFCISHFVHIIMKMEKINNNGFAISSFIMNNNIKVVLIAFKLALFGESFLPRPLCARLLVLPL